MGEAPDWYFLIHEAKYLGVPPWELLDQPLIWRQWAQAGIKAEQASAKQRKQSAARKGMNGGG